MDHPVHTESYKGYTIKVYPDQTPESPREWDNLGTMYFFHRRYNLGDKHNLSMEEVEQLANDHKNESLPVYMYDHSGITIATSPFSCPWDSGQIGHIVVTYAEMRKGFGGKKLTADHRKQALKQLQQEVDTYNEFIMGKVYGYVIEDGEGNNLYSCWGYLGDYEGYLMEEARSWIDWEINHQKEAIEQQIKDESLELQFS